MSVFDLRALRAEIEHAALCRIESVAFLPVTATVFAVASKNRAEELRRNFVVLLIRRRRVKGNRAGFQLLDVAHEVSLPLFYVAAVFLAEALPDQTPDASHQNAVGDEIMLDQWLVPCGPGLEGASSGFSCDSPEPDIHRHSKASADWSGFRRNSWIRTYRDMAMLPKLRMSTSHTRRDQRVFSL